MLRFPLMKCAEISSAVPHNYDTTRQLFGAMNVIERELATTQVQTGEVDDILHWLAEHRAGDPYFTEPGRKPDFPRAEDALLETRIDAHLLRRKNYGQLDILGMPARMPADLRESSDPE